MSKEIERKFLVGIPDFSALDVKRTVSIVQTYLAHGENGSQRRVRRIEENGRVSYTYTEKIFITPIVREEKEKNITESEYAQLLTQSRSGDHPVIKTRYCFDHLGQLFELDVYPFSDKLAIMELELNSPDQEIFLPDKVRVIKDVSGDERYSNAALAASGAFPELQIGEKD